MHDLVSKIKSYIKKLKKLPRAKRAQILWLSVIVTMVMIVIIWILTFALTPAKKEMAGLKSSESGDNFSIPDFGEMKEKIQEGIGESLQGLENIASESQTNKPKETEPAEAIKPSKVIQSLVPKDQIIETTQVNRSLDKNDFSIAINRIEFTQDKTIVYLILNNQSSEAATFREGNNIMITQDQDVYLESKSKENLFKDCLLPDTVKARKQINGVIYFDEISPDKPFTIQFLDVYHGCSTCNARDYIFEINEY